MYTIFEIKENMFRYYYINKFIMGKITNEEFTEIFGDSTELIEESHQLDRERESEIFQAFTYINELENSNPIEILQISYMEYLNSLCNCFDSRFAGISVDTNSAEYRLYLYDTTQIVQDYVQS